MYKDFQNLQITVVYKQFEGKNPKPKTTIKTPLNKEHITGHPLSTSPGGPTILVGVLLLLPPLLPE